MGRTVNSAVNFPEMRLQVVAALRSLSDLAHQQSAWGRYTEGVNYYDDFTLNVHVLYDDCMVLPEPQNAVPDILCQREVSTFAELESALGPMLRELGDQPDSAYTGDPRWLGVVTAAARALTVMEQSDVAASS